MVKIIGDGEFKQYVVYEFMGMETGNMYKSSLIFKTNTNCVSELNLKTTISAIKKLHKSERVLILNFTLLSDDF